MLHVLKIMLYATFGLLDARATAAGIAVATAAVLSSILMKFVLPHLHDRLFHHIGHAAMVIAGITMVLAASSQIARRENITLHFAHADEDVTASLSWRRHVLAVEWEHGDELELSHWLRAAPASRPGGFQSRGFVVHVSPRTGIRTARVREGCRAAGSPSARPFPVMKYKRLLEKSVHDSALKSKKVLGEAFANASKEHPFKKGGTQNFCCFYQ
ncbi:hypothetical protein RAA17_14615 [Komagataeibacter rhaeticus]|nr:hypothetical protein [Komagataeibacter rhaeticus]